ncbi:polysaccharide lyase family 8 super-sandwich domain-containing protein [Pedobacter mucosus]|uniref:polysaccharide lyase family 8 super-sandwich domain-containing protein n=1 Tax=Pedobacter mucosus TaxID=2895286 RepID=UPI001EE44328|nr:polysaccharide lyase family 8 super-sandwich domain-containing protein [Pedobacter mucosus]UKT64928.1 polysaccharide lyase beta-sandwich domain-containing protein [Pedobacter mucosus]
MKLIKYGLLVLLFLGLSQTWAQQPFQKVIINYKKFLIEQGQTPTDSLKKWINTLQQNGQWADIDYKDKGPSRWKTIVHLYRLNKISLAYQKPGNAFYKNENVWNKIISASNNWIENKYKNPNWWQNEIGVPQQWRDIITLNEKSYTKEQLANALSILFQYKLKETFTGANLVWSADLAMHYGLFTSNEELVSKARNLIIKEVKISDGEGIRPDFSYHQHGARLQAHHYGSSFLTENIRLAYELQQTPWQFPASKITILNNYLINGWQWMARGIYITPATIDRAISRSEVLKIDLSGLLEYLIQLSLPSETAELKAMLAVQKGGTQTLNGYRYFPYSDFGAYQQASFSFFVKTISTRTEITEIINGENQKGAFLNLGNTYLLRNGNEYYNLMPFWDWKHLPGTTNFTSAKTINKQRFVGGITTAADGLSVMDFETTNGVATLNGSKFWAVHQGKIFCLIAGLNLSGSTDSIYTTLEQSRLQGTVLINSSKNILTEQTSITKGVKWVRHNNFTYIPLSGSSLSVSNLKKTGNWLSIAKSGTPDQISENVFQVVATHQNNSSAAYLIDGNTEATALDKMISKPDWKILRNNRNCQAIAFNDGSIFMSFHQNDVLKYLKNSITVNQPCLLIVTKNSIYASDPLYKGGELVVILNGRTINLALPADGTTVKYDL